MQIWHDIWEYRMSCEEHITNSFNDKTPHKVLRTEGKGLSTDPAHLHCIIKYMCVFKLGPLPTEHANPVFLLLLTLTGNSGLLNRSSVTVHTVHLQGSTYL